MDNVKDFCIGHEVFFSRETLNSYLINVFLDFSGISVASRIPFAEIFTKGAKLPSKLAGVKKLLEKIRVGAKIVDNAGDLLKGADNADDAAKLLNKLDDAAEEVIEQADEVAEAASDAAKKKQMCQAEKRRM